MENTNKKQEENIHLIEDEMSEALSFWRGVMVDSSVLGWGIHLNFTKEDAFNAIYIMNSILSNIAIKSGFISKPEEAEAVGKHIRSKIFEMYGIDTTKLI